MKCFRSIDLLLAPTSVRLNIFIHVIKVIIDLLNDLNVLEGREDQLVLVISVLGILVVPSVVALSLLLFSIGKSATVIPHFKGATRHHNQALDIILKPGPLAAAEWVQA